MQEELKKKIEIEKEKEKKLRQFKAAPLPDFQKHNFQVKPSEKPLTQSARPVFLGDFVKPKKPTELPAKAPTVEGKPEWTF